MKVLIVAEQLDIHDYLRQLCPDAAIQFFQYTNPLKAMDNLEEISPAIILWNADDFPRHWKSFLPFCKAQFPHDMPRFHLISEAPLSDEETGKAEALAVDGLHSQGFFADGMADLFSASLLHNPSVVQESRAPMIPRGSGTLQLQHPVLRRFIVGELLSADQKNLHVRFAGDDIAGQFVKNMVFDHAIFRIEDVQVAVVLRVSSIEEDRTCRFLIIQFL